MNMPWWWRIVVWIVGGAITLFSFFVEPINSNLAMNFLTDVDQWIVNNAAYPSLFALGISLILSLWLVPEITFSVLHYFRAPKYWEWQTTQEELAKNERKTFFTLLDKAYSKWRNDEDTPSDVQELIASAEYPNQLPVPLGQNFRDFDFTKGFSENSKRLMAFAGDLYPCDRAETSKVLNGSDEEFHAARMGLAKFWDGTGRKIFDFHELRMHQLRSQLPSHANEIKFLTYLEWALANRLHSNGPGKQWMFRLYKSAKEKGIIV